jgi:mannose-6-phosphate isomerase-like protein (cupin superfamily)
MTTNVAAPGPIPATRMRERIETNDGGFKLLIATDAVSHGPALWFGAAHLRAGTEPAEWRAAADTHETYYVISGSIEIYWRGPHTGTSILEAGDAFFFAPDHTYVVTICGAQDAVFVWAVTPAPEPAQ